MNQSKDVKDVKDVKGATGTAGTTKAADAPESFGGYACDECETGRQRMCGHAYGYHYDPWGEGLGTPDYCPQKPDPDDPDALPW